MAIAEKSRVTWCSNEQWKEPAEDAAEDKQHTHVQHHLSGSFLQHPSKPYPPQGLELGILNAGGFRKVVLYVYNLRTELWNESLLFKQFSRCFAN